MYCIYSEWELYSTNSHIVKNFFLPVFAGKVGFI